MPPHIGVAFRRFRGASMRAALMDARPCAAPITDLRWPGKKKCSVNFRPFSVGKERSEFGNEFRVSTKFHNSSRCVALFIEELKGNGAECSRNLLTFSA